MARPVDAHRRALAGGKDIDDPVAHQDQQRTRPHVFTDSVQPEGKEGYQDKQTVPHVSRPHIVAGIDKNIEEADQQTDHGHKSPQHGVAVLSSRSDELIATDYDVA